MILKNEKSVEVSNANKNLLPVLIELNESL